MCTFFCTNEKFVTLVSCKLLNLVLNEWLQDIVSKRLLAHVSRNQTTANVNMFLNS